MKTIKRLTAILSLFLLTSCGVNWQVATLNHDPIYDDENYIVVSGDVEVDTLNAFQFRNKLRTDFQFRYDFAQYALSQPRSFDWNNRVLGNRYNSYGPYSYSHYWNRTQMWSDWVWGYTGYNSWGSPHRWSPFGYDRWGYNMHYGWNNHGWGYNNWMGNVHYGYGYGWNGYYNNNWGWRQQMNSYAWQHRNRPNTSYINGRRGSISDEITSNSNRRVRTNSSTTRVIAKPDGTRVYVRPETTIINNTKPRVVREKPIVPIIRNNNTKPVIRNNNTRPLYNNTRPSNNTRPTINRTNTSRSSTPVRTKNGNGGRNN